MAKIAIVLGSLLMTLLVVLLALGYVGFFSHADHRVTGALVAVLACTLFGSLAVRSLRDELRRLKS